jgi:hypothetical protein
MPSRPLVSLLLVLPLSAAAADSVRFNRDIRPVLSDKCFHCHGPDEKERKADLRLDSRDAAIAKNAFIPGNPDDSELVKRLVSSDPDEIMPPPDSHRTLSDSQRALLHYYLGLVTKRIESGTHIDTCDLLLVEGKRNSGTMAGPWELLWEGHRSGDNRERFRLYRSTVPPTGRTTRERP